MITPSLACRAIQRAEKSIPAVVVSAGLMQKTVKARIGVQEWNNHIKKNFNRYKNVLVHDPNNSLRTGDIISISLGIRISKTVRHVVEKLIAPFGVPAEERPQIPSSMERAMVREKKKLWKIQGKKNKRKSLITEHAITLNEEQQHQSLNNGNKIKDYLASKTKMKK